MTRWLVFFLVLGAAFVEGLAVLLIFGFGVLAIKRGLER
jgi:hypothetical protein